MILVEIKTIKSGTQIQCVPTEIKFEMGIESAMYLDVSKDA